jgi:threonine dehydratase
LPSLLIKPESLQPTGAFKLRGAYAAISLLSPEERRRGVVAHSSGNHAYAVAYAAALLDVPAVVVVPENAPKLKTDAAVACGAQLVTVAATLAARVAATEELVAAHGYTMIPPFDDPRVIAGQGTIGLEIAADCPDVDLVVVPVSGGGLISGIATALRGEDLDAGDDHGARRTVKIVGVEPESAADARDSLRQGRRVAWPSSRVQQTIADALRVEQVGALTFEHIRRYVDDIITVTDDEMLAAVRRLVFEARLIAEPGGAAAVAACLFRSDELPAAKTRVAVLSGGNIDPALLVRVLTAPPASAQ